MLGGIGRTYKTKTIYVNNTNHALLRTLLASYYRLGYHELTVVFRDRQPFSLMQEIIGSLIGYEIISQSEGACVIRDIMKEEDEPSSQLMNKLFQMINVLFGFVIEQIGGTDRSDELLTFRRNILRLRDYTKRRIRIEHLDHSYELYSLVLALEKIAGDYYYLTRQPSGSWNNEFIHALEENHAILKEIHKAYQNQDFQAANDLYLRLAKMTKEESARPERQAFCAINRIVHNMFTISSRLQAIISLERDDA